MIRWLEDYLWRWSARFLPFLIVNEQGHGHFRTINGAIDAIAANDDLAKFIFVWKGTYAPFTLDQNNVIIIGAGRGTHVTNVNDTGNEPCEVNAATGCIIAFMSFEAPGGGSGGNQDAILITNGATDNIFACNYIRDADSHAIDIDANRNIFVGNFIENADADGFVVTGNGDNTAMVCNHIRAVAGGDAINIAADGENCVGIANIGDDTFTDNSGTSTFDHNEEY